jgi:hypothetical protein
MTPLGAGIFMHKNCCIMTVEFVHETSAKNRKVWVINVDHIKGESLCSGIVEISKGYRKRYFSHWLDWFSFETLQWVFRRVQHVLAQVHLLESFEEQNVY